MRKERDGSTPLITHEFSLSTEQQTVIDFLSAARKIQPVLSQITRKNGFFITISNTEKNFFSPAEKIGETNNPDEIFNHKTSVGIGNWKIDMATPDENSDLYSVSALIIAFGAKKITYDEALRLAHGISVSCLYKFDKYADKLSAPFFSKINDHERFHGEPDLEN